MKPKKKNRMLTDLARFGHGFVYAWHGICAAVLEERNFRFHLCAALYVFAAAHMGQPNTLKRYYPTLLEANAGN